jgi:hypothetical protein
MPHVRTKNRAIAPIKTISIEHLKMPGFDNKSLAAKP